MIRRIWILAGLVLTAVSAHFGYLCLAAAPAPAGAPESVRPELIWLQREVDLAPSQLPAVNALHEEYWPRVAKSRVQLDTERRNAEVTGNPAACVAMEAQCKGSTVSFIEQVTAVLTPEQRQKYLGLVGPCLPSAASTEGVNVEQSPGR
jgi:hypothetical protein